VSTSEVEAVIAMVPGVKECSVYGVKGVFFFLGFFSNIIFDF